jgi:parallel beta-helix repeat protein
MIRSLLILVLLASLVKGATITVGPGDSIQAAIFSAHTGDMILVQEGRYYEHLKVDKPLTLQGQGMALLDATASGSAITLKASGITISGFKILNAGSWPTGKGSEAGIVILSNGNRIVGNDGSNNFNGIILRGGKNNSIRDNIVRGNLGFGIRLEKGSNNTIENNSIEENKQNCFDDAFNFWDKNHYSEFDNPGEGCNDQGNGSCDSGYAIPGGSSEDLHPVIRSGLEFSSNGHGHE